MALTKSQANKLGDRLRKEDPISEETLARLQEFRGSYDPALVQVQAALRDLGLTTTARLKTTGTIVEKLRREKTRLAEMQDIAGARTTARWTLPQQDDIVARIVDVLPDCHVDDRRRKPSAGYRAVHVIVRIDGRPVEIQVRTDLQDGWAQLYERFGDQAGRAIRYGRLLDGRLGNLQTMLFDLSALIAGHEEQDMQLVGLRRAIATLPAERLTQEKAFLEDAERDQQQHIDDLHAMLVQFGKLVSG
jgi:ppGpp synthetase/RelA/SpoT-type nucleotidyltranferase